MTIKKYYTVERMIDGNWFFDNIHTNKKDAVKEYNETKKWYADKEGKTIRLVKNTDETEKKTNKMVMKEEFVGIDK